MIGVVIRPIAVMFANWDKLILFMQQFSFFFGSARILFHLTFLSKDIKRMDCIFKQFRKNIRQKKKFTVQSFKNKIKEKPKTISNESVVNRVCKLNR